MKTDWKVGDPFMYCCDSADEKRGTLEGRVEFGSKFVVEYVFSNCISGEGWIFYFDEIKPIVKTKGELT